MTNRLTPDIVQSPVNIRVTSSVIRGGSYAPPYLIINKSLKATVWVANNPGISSGIGTQVNPGTSVTWSQPGDVYLVLGNDTKSTDVGFADVTLSYDISSWQPDPVAIAASAMNRQQVLVAGLGGGLSIATINAANPIDASLFNSIVILATPSSPTTAGTTLTVRQYQTKADAVALNTPNWIDVFPWYGTATASGGNQELRLQIPLRAPYVRVDVAGSAFWTFGSFLSSQVISDIRYGTTTQPKNGVLLDMTNVNTGNVAGGPGTNVTSLQSIPYSGDIDIYIEVGWGIALGAGALVGWLDVFDRNTAAIVNRVWMTDFTTPAVGLNAQGIIILQKRISVECDQLLWRLNNNIGNATTGYRILAVGVNDYRGN